jgi:thiosulfate dehydrogenase
MTIRKLPCLRASAFLLLVGFAAGGQAEDKTSTAPFMPPDEKDIPTNQFGDVVRLGRDIFTNTPKNASAYSGNGLSCVNCHLDRGRLAGASPLWAAYVRYPAFRKKTGTVSTYEERMQGCFKYSLNGKAPSSGSKELTALVTYSYWLAGGAPTGRKMAGAGYPAIAKPPQVPDFQRGAKVFEANCALCHGENGEGTRSGDRYVFPPLWGNDSFNWGAGMHRINTAAAFIKANMPLGRGNSLSIQDAWDVATFVDSHERPQDPRYKDSVVATQKHYHEENCSYGKEVNGEVLGTNSVPAGGKTRGH